MKLFTTILVTVLAALFLTACTQEEKKEQPATQTVQPAAPQSPQADEKAEQKMQETVTPAMQEAEQTAEMVKQEAVEAAGQVKTAAVEAAGEAKEAVTQVMPEEKPVETANAASSSQATPPVTVTYEASMGTVTFKHAEHAARLDCSRCHTTDPPQKIAIDKEVAHNQLCKVCHKESGGNAPTACPDCHKK